MFARSSRTGGAKEWLQATWVIDCNHLLTDTQGTVKTVKSIDLIRMTYMAVKAAVSVDLTG